MNVYGESQSQYELSLEREIDRLEQVVGRLQDQVEHLELENTYLQLELRRFSFGRVELSGG